MLFQSTGPRLKSFPRSHATEVPFVRQRHANHQNNFLLLCCRSRRKETSNSSNVDENLAAVDDDLFVDASLGVAPFEALVGIDARLVHVDVEEADAAVVAVVAAVAAKAGAAPVAHPEGGFA